MTWALPLNGKISRTCRMLFAIDILNCNFLFIVKFFFLFHWKGKVMLKSVQIALLQ